MLLIANACVCLFSIIWLHWLAMQTAPGLSVDAKVMVSYCSCILCRSLPRVHHFNAVTDSSCCAPCNCLPSQLHECPLANACVYNGRMANLTAYQGLLVPAPKL